MKIVCCLGRIKTPENVPGSQAKGDRNASRWVLDFEVDQTSTTVNLELVDWLSGKALPPCLLVPSVAPLNATAARSAIHFPLLDGPKLTVVVELPEDSKEPALFRVLLDAPHTLMR